MGHGNQQADLVDSIHSLHVVKRTEIRLLQGVKLIVTRALHLVDLAIRALPQQLVDLRRVRVLDHNEPTGGDSFRSPGTLQTLKF